MTKYYVSDLIKALNISDPLEFEVKSDRLIEIPEVNRVGLELTGFRQFIEPKRILILGNKEFAYIAQMSDDDLYDCFDFLMCDQTPCLIASRNNVLPSVIVEIARKKDIPILRWHGSTSRLLLQLFAILDEWFAPVELVSGTLMQINGKGILIKGPSGIGKSEIALELMKKGHNLVSDDSVEVHLFDNRLVGKAPKLIRNMIEIRGVGILDVTQLFGHSIISEQAQIDYVIELSKWDKKLTYERVGDNRLLENILGIELEKLVLPVSEGRSMADVIEVSVTNFKLQEKGINVSADFAKKIEDELKEKSDV
ncbi:HPr kinase/phosphorylase [Bacilli bacterium PM5-3]|nr:HPr kinase/phosphorylase [Bacilli bacterium PM5-3]MDH6603610.1 HPr kinase/phosphorylase [Bacilli bacterium PM5-9]